MGRAEGKRRREASSEADHLLRFCSPTSLLTGGSSGLGMSLAELLASKGAHVTIVARNQERLDTALALVKVS